MAISLGVFDPTLTSAEAYAVLCCAIPDLPERLAMAESEYTKTSLFRHFVTDDTTWQRLNFGPELT